MPMNNRPQYAVLIDAENITAEHAEPILKEITKFGEPSLRRVYADWSLSNLKPWTETVRKLGLVALQQSANTKRKNATDIGLVIDAMDILHSGRYDGFVLVSSDSDFTALANRIREHGLNVIGIGEKKTPVSLRNSYNRFIFIENIAKEKPVAASNDQKEPKRTSTKGVVKLIKAAMDKIEQEDVWYPLSVLGNHIIAAKSDFDSRTYGFKKLSDLVLKLGQFETRKVGTQMQVKLKS